MIWLNTTYNSGAILLGFEECKRILKSNLKSVCFEKHYFGDWLSFCSALYYKSHVSVFLCCIIRVVPMRNSYLLASFHTAIYPEFCNRILSQCGYGIQNPFHNSGWHLPLSGVSLLKGFHQ